MDKMQESGERRDGQRAQIMKIQIKSIFDIKMGLLNKPLNFKYLLCVY